MSWDNPYKFANVFDGSNRVFHRDDFREVAYDVWHNLETIDRKDIRLPMKHVLATAMALAYYHPYCHQIDNETPIKYLLIDLVLTKLVDCLHNNSNAWWQMYWEMLIEVVTSFEKGNSE